MSKNMNTKNTALITLALAGLISSGIATAEDHAPAAADQKWEKCYGIAKKGQNDCKSAGHACSGQAKKDHSPREFKNVLEGTCAKMGGKLEPMEHNKSK